jgi:perosamine synthetase
MAPDGQLHAPNVYDAEPIPEAARAEIDRLLLSGDLSVIPRQVRPP